MGVKVFEEATAKMDVAMQASDLLKKMPMMENEKELGRNPWFLVEYNKGLISEKREGREFGWKILDYSTVWGKWGKANEWEVLESRSPSEEPHAS